ncbi:MAG: ABC transporter substrate-binding protein [Desulfobacterales bacterium]|nr:ABC transporter substrate-binding protein [Desulfobacterales bacterium]
MNKAICFILLFLFIPACSRDKGISEITDIPDTYVYAPMVKENPNLDPSAIWESENTFMLRAFYDSLFRYNRSGEIKPNLVQSFTIINSENPIYRLTLRSDVFFHDDPCFPNSKGRRLTADDVVFTIKRIADPSHANELYPMIEGLIIGLDDFREHLEKRKGKISDPVKGLVVTNETELEIHLSKPMSEFLYILAMPEFGIVPSEAVLRYKKEFRHHPVGTGPFHLVLFDERKLIAQRMNSHFRFEQKPEERIPEGIVFIYHEDMSTLFREGKLDILPLKANRIHSFLDESYQIKKDIEAKGYQVKKIESPELYYLMFNFDEPVMQNRHLRKAIASAVPWQLLIDATAISHASFIPKGIMGYVDVRYEYNPEITTSELIHAGYPDGKDLPELIIRFTDLHENMLRYAAMIEDSLDQLGISSRIDYNADEIINGAHMGIFAWTMDFPDAKNILSLLDSTSTTNDWHYLNSDYNRIFNEASGANDKEIISYYDKAARHIFEDVAAIPFCQPVEYWAMSQRISNVEFVFGWYIAWDTIRFPVISEQLNNTQTQ